MEAFNFSKYSEDLHGQLKEIELKVKSCSEEIKSLLESLNLAIKKKIEATPTKPKEKPKAKLEEELAEEQPQQEI